MNKFKKIIIISLALTLFFSAVPISQAGEGAFTDTLKANFDSYLMIVGAGPGYDVQSPENTPGILANVITLIVSLVGIIFLILVIFSGIQWMTASGNEEKISSARKRMIQASIGLGITVCAFIISYTVFSFSYQEYLDTPYGGINPPENSQNLITCSGLDGGTPIECADRAPRIYCLGGNCVECLTDEDCEERPDIPASATFCHQTWNVCMLPENTTCNDISDPGLCIGQGCKWIVDSPQHDTWSNGRCDESSNPCPQCTEDVPVCIESGGVTSCVECVDEEIQGACTTLFLCTGGNFCLW